MTSFLSFNLKSYKIFSILFLFTLLTLQNIQAQCPAAPASNAAAIVSNATVGAITMSTPSEVRYVTGNVVLGTSANAHSLTIGLNTTVVVTTGSHLTVTNVSVSGKLIIQAGATVSVVGLTGANGSLGVNAGGIIEMCENTGLENCGTTTFTPNPSVNYTGATGGKAVIKTINKSGQVGSLVMSSLSPGLTTSSNITVATPVVNGFFPTPGGSYGSAVSCNIGSNCGTLPFDVNGSCGSFATPAATCNAGNTAPTFKQ